MTTVKDGDPLGRAPDGSGIEPFEVFDVADHLDSPAMVAEYLSGAFAEADPVLVAEALRTAARASGMGDVAAVGPAGEWLTMALRSGAPPTLDTVLKLISALGFRLVVQPVPARGESIEPVTGD